MSTLVLASLLSATPSWTVSVETDPIFWVGTVPNGPAVDFNVDVTLAAVPGLRVGVLGWSGRWANDFARAAVLPTSFSEPEWAVRWSGLGIEAQYQFRLGLDRGGLGPGVRLQWSHFRFDRGGLAEAEANHLVVTPQLGFQWFPVRTWALYLLPWAGVQLPVAGTRDVETLEGRRDSRRVLAVITAHVGWAF